MLFADRTLVLMLLSIPVCDFVFFSGARNVSIVGWGNPPNVTPTIAYETSEQAQAKMMDAGAATAALARATTTAVLSCEGRHSQDDSGPATRGLWLVEGRITSLANLTVTGAEGGWRRAGHALIFRLFFSDASELARGCGII